MKPFKITIEETISETFEVQASSREEAITIAKEKYRTEEFILSPGEVVGRQIAATLPNQDITSWEEL